MNSEAIPTPFGSEDYSSIERSPLHENENILHQLVEVRDHSRQLSDFLIDSLLADRRGLVVMGEPGNGKTTITAQLRDALEKEAQQRDMKVEVVLNRYDEFLAQKEAEYGKRELWTPDEWQGLNDYMYEKYTQALDEGDGIEGVRRIHLLELPAVGSDEERDRGVRASRKLFERAEKQEMPDTHFIFVAINTLLQQKSAFLRRVIVDPSLPDSEVVPLLALHNQIVIGNFSEVEKGRRVKEIFKKSAQPEHIAAIRKEAAEEIAVWEDQYNRNKFAEAVKKDPNASRDARNYDVLAERMKGMRRPIGVTDEKVREVYGKYNTDVDNAFFQVKASTVLDAAMRQAAYAEHVLHYIYHLDDDTAFVVHNPYDPTSVITIDIGDEYPKVA